MLESGFSPCFNYTSNTEKIRYALDVEIALDIQV